MNLELSESQLTAIIKEAMTHYAAKHFGGARYVQTLNGILVQFYDVGAEQPTRDDTEEQLRRRSRREQDDEDERRRRQQQLQAFSIPTFGGSDVFGGGQSGGGGASSGW